jgi:hypothetical protein
MHLLCQKRLACFRLCNSRIATRLHGKCLKTGVFHKERVISRGIILTKTTTGCLGLTLSAVS